MAPKIEESLKALMDFIGQSDKRRSAIMSGQGEPGHRAAPPRGGNHGARIGSRIDFGEIVEKDGKEFRRYKFQLNSDAEDSTLKKMAAQDSHAVYSSADVEIKSDRTKEEEEEDFKKFEKELLENLED